MAVPGADPARGLFLIEHFDEHAPQLGIVPHVPPFSTRRNTIRLARQGVYPGGLHVEERLAAILRWNALVMVVSANVADGELGGHFPNCASVAESVEFGFNRFFRKRADGRHGDLVNFQPRSAPGVCSRAFLEGRLSDAQLANQRQEIAAGPGSGLCSPRSRGRQRHERQ